MKYRVKNLGYAVNVTEFDLADDERLTQVITRYRGDSMPTELYAVVEVVEYEYTANEFR